MDLFTAKSNFKKLEREMDGPNFNEALYIQALEYLVENDNDSYYPLALGGYYYTNKKFELAKKYYEIACLDKNNYYAFNGLGYVHYYGRCGERDYKLAFEYYSHAAKGGIIEAKVKIADMYKNGYYVKKDYSKYKQLVKELFDQTDSDDYFYPEIAIRMAKINKYDENIDQAIKLFIQARIGLENRCVEHVFFGNFNMISWIIDDLYSIEKYKNIPKYINIYDAYYYLKERNTKMSFSLYDKKYEIIHSAENDEDYFVIDNNYYHNLSELFMKAIVEDYNLSYYVFEVEDISFE